MSIPPRNPGLPILSGPPPVIESSGCRQCQKPFVPLIRRAHVCGHCGYEYCSTCLSDGQALMPRKAGESSTSGNSSNPFSMLKEELGFGPEKRSGNGYEVESVCTHCLGMLQVTAAPLPILRSLPLKRLKEYLAAYDIPCVGPKEKEDFVQAIAKARDPVTGALSPQAESHYRRRSVPKNGQLPSATPAPAARPSTGQAARPPPNGTYRQTPASHQQARPPPPNQYRPPHVHQHRPPPPTNQYRPPPPQHTPAQPTPPRPTPKSPPKAAAPPPPVPTILSLVSLPKSYLSSLSIGTLKAILYENHVRVDFKQVLEKEELINRVSELVTDERKRLERQRIEEERYANGNTTPEHAAGETDGSVEGVSTTDKAVPTGPAPEIDRGLCVVCQDEEATLAVVDCGHLAMCAACSDLIMATSQECPLCRTRIVTPQRLIRIYRT